MYCLTIADWSGTSVMRAHLISHWNCFQSGKYLATTSAIRSWILSALLGQKTGMHLRRLQREFEIYQRYGLQQQVPRETINRIGLKLSSVHDD